MNKGSMYIINYNTMPAMGAIQKFIKKQSATNKSAALFMLAVGIYTYLNEKRQSLQTKELENLREEIEQLKGERMMK